MNWAFQIEFKFTHCFSWFSILINCSRVGFLSGSLFCSPFCCLLVSFNEFDLRNFIELVSSMSIDVLFRSWFEVGEVDNKRWLLFKTIIDLELKTSGCIRNANVLFTCNAPNLFRILQTVAYELILKFFSTNRRVFFELQNINVKIIARLFARISVLFCLEYLFKILLLLMFFLKIKLLFNFKPKSYCKQMHQFLIALHCFFFFASTCIQKIEISIYLYFKNCSYVHNMFVCNESFE